MQGRANEKKELGWVLVALLIWAGSTSGRELPRAAQFKYAAGTENLAAACAGNLEVTSAALTFKCPGGSVTAPYASISLMQYRSDVSWKVRKMKLQWKVKPPYGGGTRNRYFTVLYTEQGATHAIVLEVSSRAMRPYLAEIDLIAGKRVEVKGYEKYH